MRHFSFFLFLVMVSLLSVSTIDQASAQSNGRALNIAVIDIAQAEMQSKVWQNLRQQFEARLNGYQTELRDKQNALEQQGRDLQQQQAILAPDAFNVKRQEFDKQVAQLQQTAAQRKQDLDKAYGSARQQIREALRKVVADIANERKIDLVLSNSPTDRAVLLIGDPNLAITEEATRRLDTAIQTVTLPPVK